MGRCIVLDLAWIVLPSALRSGLSNSTPFFFVGSLREVSSWHMCKASAAQGLSSLWLAYRALLTQALINRISSVSNELVDIGGECVAVTFSSSEGTPVPPSPPGSG